VSGSVAPKKVISDFPPRLYAETEAAAKELGMSRSELMRRAMRYFLRHRQKAKLARSIEDYFARHGESERALTNEFIHADAETL